MPTSLIALAQLNPIVGDLGGNAAHILHAARTAYAQGARLLITAELSLTGYSPQDLLLRPDFLAASDAALTQLAQDLHAAAPDMQVLVGHPTAQASSAQYGQQRFNGGVAPGPQCAVKGFARYARTLGHSGHALGLGYMAQRGQQCGLPAGLVGFLQRCGQVFIGKVGVSLE